MRSVRSLPLRVRLVAGYACAMLVVLTAAAAFVYWRVEFALDRALDAELSRAATDIRPLVAADGTLSSPAQAAATGAGWQVLDADGSVLTHGGPVPARALLDPEQVRDVQASRTTYDVGSMLPVSRSPRRVVVTGLPEGRRLLVAVGRNHRDEALRELLAQLAIAGLGALVLSSLVGDVLARLALRPVERYRRDAAEIAAGADGLRLEVPEGRDDEVSRLGHTLNAMLASLQDALEHERAFVDDASHELRTPLTLLSGRIQLAQRRRRTSEEHERVLDELAIDVARLVELADDLLELDRPAKLGGDEPHAVPDVTDVAAVACRLADGRPDVALDLPGSPVLAVAPVRSVERVLANLLRNAELHGEPPVTVRVVPADGHVLVTVTDHGEGMPADLLARATGRFVRADDARSRPGSGLGLAIVAQLVERAGGELRLCQDGRHVSHGRPSGVACDHDDGTAVSVILPGVPPTRP
ncbi:MAG TPA: ATP-binding protein [Nocardioides sp.]|nr:ATP-binding protein [Nocardioides sp.]